MAHIKLIGISGKAGSGKDAVGSVLHDAFGFERVAFGDAVKSELSGALLRAEKYNFSVFRWIAFWLFSSKAAGMECLADYYEAMPRRVRYEFIMLIGAANAPFVKPTSKRVRTLLQWWGTEFRREQDPDYWIDRLHRSPEFRHSKLVYIPDVRFPNELEWLKEQGGLSIRVRRPGVSSLKHDSEDALDGALFDDYVNNDGTLEDLRQEVLDAVYTSKFLNL